MLCRVYCDISVSVDKTKQAIKCELGGALGWHFAVILYLLFVLYAALAWKLIALSVKR